VVLGNWKPNLVTLFIIIIIIIIIIILLDRQHGRMRDIVYTTFGKDSQTKQHDKQGSTPRNHVIDEQGN